MEIVIFYTTVPNMETAIDMSNTLLAEKLIACSNANPISSYYEWNGRLCTENEIAIHFKSSIAKTDELERRISSLHPYETPAIIHWTAQVNEKYGQWVDEQVKL
jgi:periplasmic divalent cation tolerance protein